MCGMAEFTIHFKIDLVKIENTLNFKYEWNFKLPNSIIGVKQKQMDFLYKINIKLYLNLT